VLILMIAFWCVHEPKRIGMMIAFVFGLLMDVHDVGVLGSMALSYALTAYGALVLQRRLQRFDVWRQAMHMLPIFFGARLVTMLIGAWIAGSWPGWSWTISTVLTAALWPLASWMLLFFQRGSADVQSTSV
jgi:rod shape-determining protein MreD